jgi:hypothetical protein
LEFYDAPTVQKITTKLLASDCKAEMLMMEVAQSYPFLYRRNAPTVKLD